jgi:hypothetical protein
MLWKSFPSLTTLIVLSLQDSWGFNSAPAQVFPVHPWNSGAAVYDGDEAPLDSAFGSSSDSDSEHPRHRISQLVSMLELSNRIEFLTIARASCEIYARQIELDSICTQDTFAKLMCERSRSVMGIDLYTLSINPSVFFRMGKSRPASAWLPNLGSLLLGGKSVAVMQATPLMNHNLKFLDIYDMEWKVCLETRTIMQAMIFTKASLMAPNLGSLILGDVAHLACDSNLTALLQARSISCLSMSGPLPCQTAFAPRNRLVTLGNPRSHCCLVFGENMAADVFPKLRRKIENLLRTFEGDWHDIRYYCRP